MTYDRPTKAENQLETKKMIYLKLPPHCTRERHNCLQCLHHVATKKMNQYQVGSYQVHQRLATQDIKMLIRWSFVNNLKWWKTRTSREFERSLCAWADRSASQILWNYSSNKGDIGRYMHTTYGSYIAPVPGSYEVSSYIEYKYWPAGIGSSR